ncbi:unnamed protein product [Candidula unifasciata]|uniref:Small acidic protein-like domain-containing protein n=1 Tax=Candidula unifasciata TaxID=100452 RepID=A0A8S3ZKB6_9EUPU|nr:unnamed protein product [Candidula unifasciata]
MKGEIKCDDDQKNSLSKEERRQKKEERRKKKKERLDKENTTHVEHLCEDAAKTALLEVVTEKSKKKHKKKKHSSDSVGDDIVSDGKAGEHSINEGNIKRQKTEDINQTTNNCDSSPVGMNSKKKKRKKEKTIATNPLCDTSELPGDRQDVTQSAKKKNKKHKKAKTELADMEKVKPARTVSLLETDGDTTHETKDKKNKRASLSQDETTEDTKHTCSKENISNPVEVESSKCKKKKRKHSKYEDCGPVHDTDSEIPRKKHKTKSKSISKHKDDALQGNTEEHNSVETQDITKHVTNNADISQTSDKGSKHKKQKHQSKNSPADSTDKNFNGKEEICSEVTACDKSTSDVMMKPELGLVGNSAATLGNWQGNLFENDERQNKFLRLLGGMKKSSNATVGMSSKHSATLAGTKKKGLFGSLASLSNTVSSGGNMALDVNAAANLNQKLEDEYNKAMNFKLSGKVGTGFGFVKDPAEGKKFHIDVTKSKSIKFNDD